MDIDKLENKHSITFEKYITNPSGNKGNLFLNMSMVKGNLQEKFDKLLYDKKDNFALNVYKHGGNFILYVKVPSSRYDLFYDVVFEIQDRTNEDKPLDRVNLSKCEFKVFSNCPSFAFTYAHIFNNRKLIIDELVSKYAKDIIKRPPYEKNYYEIVAMEKSLFYAISYLLSRCTTLEDVNNLCEKGNCFSAISTTDDKLFEYKQLQQAESKERRKEEKDKVRKETMGRVLKANIKKGDSGRIITGKEKRKAPKSKVKGKRKIK